MFKRVFSSYPNDKGFLNNSLINPQILVQKRGEWFQSFDIPKIFN